LFGVLGYDTVEFGKIKCIMYEIIFLPVVLCGCGTWFLTLTKKYRLRVFENRVLRGIFGGERDEVTGVEKTT
jgi:hypothetical protein